MKNLFNQFFSVLLMFFAVGPVFPASFGIVRYHKTVSDDPAMSLWDSETIKNTLRTYTAKQIMKSYAEIYEQIFKVNLDDADDSALSSLSYLSFSPTKHFDTDTDAYMSDLRYKFELFKNHVLGHRGWFITNVSSDSDSE